jgi:Polyketide cyclase / dehydrase and lipid transport
VKPVTVSIEVPNPRQQVYDFLERLANHESFTDHFLLDWELSGPARGVGAKANVRIKAARNDPDWTAIEVIQAEPPRKLVEESVGGARARRRAHATYLLDELPGGGTLIALEQVNLEMPFGERVMGPVNRAYLKRVNGKALRRLAEHLPRSPGEPAS